jgi:hypothetical protein
MADSKSLAVEQADEVSVSDNAELKRLLPASPSAAPLPPIRRLVADRVPYSGATLAEVLCARQVLSLCVNPPVAAEPLTLPPSASAKDMLVTTLDIDRAGYAAAAPISSLITSFPALTSLYLHLPRSPVGSELLKMLCATLQSSRGWALETLILPKANLRECGSQLATALLLLSRSLTELHLMDCIGSDANAAEVVTALSATRKLTILAVHSIGEGAPAPTASSLTAAALADVLRANDSLTSLMADFSDDTASASVSGDSKSPSCVVPLVEALRANPRSALTHLDLSRGSKLNPRSAAAVPSLVDCPSLFDLSAPIDPSVPYARRVLHCGARDPCVACCGVLCAVAAAGAHALPSSAAAVHAQRSDRPDPHCPARLRTVQPVDGRVCGSQGARP